MAMLPTVLFAYEPAALLTFNNLSDLTSASSARTALGLGTAAVKAASGAGGTVASVTGSFTATHLATFADTSGTIQDGGAYTTYDATNVSITGGAIDGTTLGATTRSSVKGTTGDFNGILTTGSGRVHAARVVIASGAIAAATTDDIIVVNKTVGAASALSLFASPATGVCVTVKDGKGDANTNNITITPAAGNIDGSGTFVMNQNYQSNQLCYNGTQWNVTL
jgi:hypothetical protein